MTTPSIPHHAPAAKLSKEEELRKARIVVTLACVVLGAIVVVFAVKAVETWRQAAVAAERERISQKADAKRRADELLAVQQAEAAFRQMTPEQHFAMVEKDLTTDAVQDRIDDGMKHLQALKGTPLERQGEAVRSRYEAQKKQAEKAQAAAAERQKKAAEADSKREAELARIAMAKSIEDGILAQGYDVDVNAIGTNHTVLRIRFPVVDKSLAYMIAHNQETIETSRQAGFKRIVLTDGYDELWHIDL
jgi:hypothetical protein